MEDMDYCSPGLELAQRQFNDLHTTLSSVSERIKSGKAVIVHKGQWQKNFKQLLGGLEEIKTKVGELTREYGEFKKLEEKSDPYYQLLGNCRLHCLEQFLRRNWSW